VERGLDAREIEVAVLGNDDPIVSVPGEIRPSGDFYDYAAKYVSDDAELIIPADLDHAQVEEVRRLALRTYSVLECAGMGRVDLLLERSTGRFFVNEINTLPGFTSISMYPRLWEASGVPYPELLDRLIGLALERHRERATLVTSWQPE
jgi:D-alanine-D-alanine ligase